MTEKQLESEVRAKFKQAEHLLQMPPVLQQMRQEKHKIISTDLGLVGFDESSYVFTDVTFGLKYSDRSVVIRHPDGVLEEAPYDVRKRVHQIYFPQASRKFRDPKMFEPENLKRLYSEEEYEFVLDTLCLQYEPFEEMYHQVTSQIYQLVNDNEHFEKLRSTRHFGPMVFFLAWHKMIDGLVLDMIRNDYLPNAAELICLMFKLNSIKVDTNNIMSELKKLNGTERLIRSTIDAMLSKTDSGTKKIEKTNEDLRIDELCYGFILEAYVKQHSLKKGQLELALQSYKERHNELKSIAQGVN